MIIKKSLLVENFLDLGKILASGKILLVKNFLVEEKILTCGKLP